MHRIVTDKEEVKAIFSKIIETRPYLITTQVGVETIRKLMKNFHSDEGGYIVIDSLVFIQDFSDVTVHITDEPEIIQGVYNMYGALTVSHINHLLEIVDANSVSA